MKDVHLIVWAGCAGIASGTIFLQGSWMIAVLAAIAAVYANLAYRRECNQPIL